MFKLNLHRTDFKDGWSGSVAQLSTRKPAFNQGTNGDHREKMSHSVLQNRRD